MYAGWGLEFISKTEIEKNHTLYRGFTDSYWVTNHINQEDIQSLKAKKIILRGKDEYLITNVPFFLAIKDIKKFISLNEVIAEETSSSYLEQELKEESLYTDNHIASSFNKYK